VDEITDWGQLLLLRNITCRTGALHEAQVVQLKYYPLITTHATKASFSYNFDDKILIYNLLETKGRKPKDFKKNLKDLTTFTHNLLGEEYTVIIKLKNKIISKILGNKDAGTETTFKRCS